MSVLLLTADLATSSSVSGAAARCNVACQTVWSVDAVAAKAAEIAARLVILDLSTPAIDPASLVPLLRQQPSPPRIVAFGPHVHAARLAAARDAGCDQVLSRGGFHAEIDRIVGSAAGENPE
jgi:DNA-binding NarL/FixJ family response regulator